MLAVSVELVHELLRATSADDVSLTGSAVSHEWPPSPARLFAALVAGGGTAERVPEHVGTKGLDKLEGQVPDIFASPGSETFVSDLQGRFVVIDERSEGAVQNYPARTQQKVQPGARVSPRVPRVVFVWPDVNLNADEQAALRYRAARIPYVGCSDSPARVRIHLADPPVNGLARWHPDDSGSTSLPVPPLGFLGQLDAHFARWTAGAPARRAWLSTPMCSYRGPDDAPAAPPLRVGTTFWVRFHRPVQQRRTVEVSQLLRAAVLERVEQAVGGRHAVPEVLHGHLSARGPEHHSSRWLPLPTVDVPHADGRLRGAAVWLPPGCDPYTVQLLRDALAGVSTLVLPGVFATGIETFDGTNRPWSSHPARWSGPAKTWRSVTPVLHDRRVKGPLRLDDVARWCAHAGLPSPIDFRTSPAPFVEGARRLAPAELSRGDRPAGPRSYIEVTFAEPVAGPLALGRGRGYGIGLLAPAQGSRS